MLGAYAEWAVSALLAGEERRARELMSAAIACARAHCSSWKYHGAERAIHETRR